MEFGEICLPLLFLQTYSCVFKMQRLCHISELAIFAGTKKKLWI